MSNPKPLPAEEDFWEGIEPHRVLTPDQAHTVESNLHQAMVDVKCAAKRGKYWDAADSVWDQLVELTKNFPDEQEG